MDPTTLKTEIERFLRTGEGEFEPLALALFAYQFERNVPYRAFCEAQGQSPAGIARWQDIPAVPIAAFKSAELTTFPVAHAAALFESSGTTQIRPSRHFLKTLTFYETALKTSFAQWVLGDAKPLPFMILAPAPGEAPRSSLTWMLDVVKRQWGGTPSDYFVQRGRLDAPRLVRILKSMEQTTSPVALLGTTIAFLEFFDYLSQIKQTFKLVAGSRVMDTGGLKTQKRAVSRPDFVRSVGQALGIPESLCINEYGMCELSSQFYGKGASSMVAGPPWVRTLVVEGEDPSKAVPRDSSGLLRHFDLANVDSVMAIQTEDMGTAELTNDPDSEGSCFTLLGRAPLAALKGCSLAAESFLP